MPELSREQWLEERRKGLGGTDSPRVLGLSHWGGPYEVYCEKLGLVTRPFDRPETRCGRWMEPHIATLYAEKFECKLVKGEFFKSPKTDWLLASPDYFIQGQPVGLDCKLVLSEQSAQRWGAEGTDEMPQEYWAQAAHYLVAMPNIDHWIMAPMIDGEVRRYVVRRDAQYEEMLLDGCERFWRDHVVAGVEPTPTPNGVAREYMLARWPKNNGQMLTTMDDATREVIADLLAARKEIKPLKDRAEAATLFLQTIIGSYDGLQIDDDNKITWRKSKDGEEVDWQGAMREILTHFKLTDKQISEASKIIDKYRVPKEGSRRFLVGVE